MGLEELPGRIFLDTCVVNFILDCGEQIHDGALPPTGLGDRAVADIDASRVAKVVELEGPRQWHQFARLQQRADARMKT